MNFDNFFLSSGKRTKMGDIMGQSPMGLIIGAISDAVSGGKSPPPGGGVTTGAAVPLTPSIYAQNPKVTYDPSRADRTSPPPDDLDTTTVLYVAGGIVLIIVLVRWGEFFFLYHEKDIEKCHNHLIKK